MTYTIANRLDPDQGRQNVGSKLFDTLMTFLKDIFLQKIYFEKKSKDERKKSKFPSLQRVKLKYALWLFLTVPWVGLQSVIVTCPGPKVITLEYGLKLKIKRNAWLLNSSFITSAHGHTHLTIRNRMIAHMSRQYNEPAHEMFVRNAQWSRF